MSLSPTLRMAGAETVYLPASTQNVVGVSERSLLIMLSISLPDFITVPVQPQVEVAPSARFSVVATNATRASNGTSRIKRLLTTASLVLQDFLQDLSQSFSRMNLASLTIKAHTTRHIARESALVVIECCIDTSSEAARLGCCR